MRGSTRLATRMTGAVIAAAMTASLGLTGNAAAQSAAAKAATALDALVAAARSEGEVTFYSAMPESATKRVSDAFTAKYGVKTQFVRVSSTALMQRYATEADAGNIAADLVFVSAGGATVTFANEGIKKGWVESVSTAGIPVIMAGTYPSKFNYGPTAVAGIAPWYISYNTDKVKGADIPKDWKDLANPKWKGQLILTNPAASDAYADFWAAILDRYGEGYFAQLRAQNPRQYGDGIQATQGLSAGEGAFAPPAVGAMVQGPAEKGAPLAMALVDYTTGVEMQVMLTARAKSKHPNAARLMANYVLSEEGNRVFNADIGTVTLYDTSKLPREYQMAKPGNAARRAEFQKLLGF